MEGFRKLFTHDVVNDSQVGTVVGVFVAACDGRFEVGLGSCDDFVCKKTEFDLGRVEFVSRDILYVFGDAASSDAFFVKREKAAIVIQSDILQFRINFLDVFPSPVNCGQLAKTAVFATDVIARLSVQLVVALESETRVRECRADMYWQEYIVLGQFAGLVATD